jgi:hypothetical protein
MYPGTTEFTLMPAGPSSFASVRAGREEGALRRRVAAHHRFDDADRQRVDEDDRAVRPRLHLGNDELGEAERAEQVDLEDAPPVVEIGLVDEPDRIAQERVVDEGVHATELGESGLD